MKCKSGKGKRKAIRPSRFHGPHHFRSCCPFRPFEPFNMHCNLSAFSFPLSHFSFIHKKKDILLKMSFFYKSGDDLLSHNVAGKRVKHQACLSVLQRAGATSWNNYMQCTSCLQYNELQGLPSQGGIIEKRNPELSSRVSK